MTRAIGPFLFRPDLPGSTLIHVNVWYLFAGLERKARSMMLEAYEAYGSYDTMAELTRDLVVDAARAVGKTVVPARDGSAIDLEAPWRNATLHELVSEAVGTEVTIETSMDALRALADANEVGLQPHWDAGAIVLELFEKLVEHTLIQPTFVRDYPEIGRAHV